MKSLAFFLLWFAACRFALGAVGSWNGIAFTQWNGVAQTSWNGTTISCAGGGGGSVTWIASGALGVSATTTTIAVVSPACNVGDLLIATVVNRELTVTISAPDGTWTPVVTQANADVDGTTNDHRYSVWWKTATTSGESFTFTKSANNNINFCGVITAFRGHNATTPIDATAPGVSVNPTAADNVTFTSFDPTLAGHAVFVAFYDNSTTFAAAMSGDTDPDCTIRFDLETSLGNDATIAMTSGDTSGANIAARTWASASTTDGGSTGVVFSIRP